MKVGWSQVNLLENNNCLIVDEWGSWMLSRMRLIAAGASCNVWGDTVTPARAHLEQTAP